eukprot:GHVH01001315.1.p1 GENE.GHVH01001315.1~~GHVH01001315.1.p1  ORF type:complete len:692 (+),score=93.23 GHVH01001315.1:83-2158(+)
MDPISIYINLLKYESTKSLIGKRKDVDTSVESVNWKKFNIVEHTKSILDLINYLKRAKHKRELDNVIAPPAGVHQISSNLLTYYSELDDESNSVRNAISSESSPKQLHRDSLYIGGLVSIYRQQVDDLSSRSTKVLRGLLQQRFSNVPEIQEKSQSSKANTAGVRLSKKSRIRLKLLEALQPDVNDDGTLRQSHFLNGHPPPDTLKHFSLPIQAFLARSSDGHSETIEPVATFMDDDPEASCYSGINLWLTSSVDTIPRSLQLDLTLPDAITCSPVVEEMMRLELSPWDSNYCDTQCQLESTLCCISSTELPMTQEYIPYGEETNDMETMKVNVKRSNESWIEKIFNSTRHPQLKAPERLPVRLVNGLLTKGIDINDLLGEFEEMQETLANKRSRTTKRSSLKSVRARPHKRNERRTVRTTAVTRDSILQDYQPCLGHDGLDNGDYQEVIVQDYLPCEVRDIENTLTQEMEIEGIGIISLEVDADESSGSQTSEDIVDLSSSFEHASEHQIEVVTAKREHSNSRVVAISLPPLILNKLLLEFDFESVSTPYLPDKSITSMGDAALMIPPDLFTTADKRVSSTLKPPPYSKSFVLTRLKRTIEYILARATPIEGGAITPNEEMKCITGGESKQEDQEIGVSVSTLIQSGDSSIRGRLIYNILHLVNDGNYVIHQDEAYGEIEIRHTNGAHSV